MNNYIFTLHEERLHVEVIQENGTVYINFWNDYCQPGLLELSNEQARDLATNILTSYIKED